MSLQLQNRNLSISFRKGGELDVTHREEYTLAVSTPTDTPLMLELFYEGHPLHLWMLSLFPLSSLPLSLYLSPSPSLSLSHFSQATNTARSE